jgi:hypothetical protein
VPYLCSGQGAPERLDLLGQREEYVKALISGVPGFVNYAAVRSRRMTDSSGWIRTIDLTMIEAAH